MGRGTDNTANAMIGPSTRRTTIQKQTTTLANSAFMQADNDQNKISQIIELPDGTQLQLDAEDAMGTLEGLTNIAKVEQNGMFNNQFFVTLQNGDRAIVDLEKMSVSSQNNLTAEEQQGILAAAIGAKAYSADYRQQTEEQQKLGDMYENFRRAMFSPEEFTPEQLAEIYSQFASLSSQEIANNGSDITLNDPDMLNKLNPQKRRGLPREMKRAHKERMQKRVRAAIETYGTAGPAFLAHPNMNYTVAEMNSQLEMAGLTPQPDDMEISEENPLITNGQMRLRKEASKILGAPIHETRIQLEEEENEEGEIVEVSVGEYEVGDKERIIFDLVQNSVCIDRRAFAFEGMPGTGKDEAAKEIAALYSLPLKRINLGPKTSVEDLLGGEILEPETYQTKDGKLKTVTESKQHLGELGQALKYPSLVVIQEPEGKQDEFVRLHSILGDNVGTTEGRVFTINSPSGEMVHKVHPETIIIFTYNGNKGTVRFKQAFYDRVTHLSFPYPEQADEAKRYAKMCNLMFEKNPDMPKALQKEITDRDTLPVVKLISRARTAATDDATDVLDTPGGRQGVMVFEDLTYAGWNIDGYDKMSEQEQNGAVAKATKDTVQSALSYIFPHKRMDADSRKALIDTMFLKDLDTELEEVVRKGALARTQKKAK